MADATGIEQLRKLEQVELASIYAERCACSIIAQQSQPSALIKAELPSKILTQLAELD